MTLPHCVAYHMWRTMVASASLVMGTSRHRLHHLHGALILNCMPAGGRAAAIIASGLDREICTAFHGPISIWLKSHSGWRPGRIARTCSSLRSARTSRYFGSHPIWLNTYIMTTTTCHFNQPMFFA
ncbi:hypothetical protein F4860DRAFT_425319 [Xylaria cubensis]|nr:hypothetical protein F4860DRAFT_425319 [Xylaria cubensis]